MIVADASAILELLLQSDVAPVIETRLFASGETIHVPALLDLEVAQVMRRYVLRSELSVARARASLDVLAGLPMERHLHESLINRIWELRENLMVHDGAYVALAEGLRATLVTCDAKLANASGISARVELIRRTS
jgi:predicted nucleic acid-binding protein